MFKSNKVKSAEEAFRQILPAIQENVLLKNYTGYRVGGPARFFLLARKQEEIISAITAARKLKISNQVIGGGYNLLVSDKGYNGLVIKNQVDGLEIIEGSDGCEIHCGGGVLLSTVVKVTAEKGLNGFSWAGGIPGTVGGSIYGNAAAFDGAMADCVFDVMVLDAKTLKVKSLCGKNAFCFKYRESRFKKDKNLVILKAVLKFKFGDKEKITEEIRARLKYRKINHPLDYPSAGSVFKNIEISSKKEIKIADKFFINNPQFNFFKGRGFIPAGMIIESCGLKGKTIGGAQISDKHANFIINRNNASAKDIIALINLVKSRALRKYGIKMIEEIQRLGFSR